MSIEFRELSDKIYPHISDKAKQAIDSINDAFDEAQHKVYEMRRLANFTEGKPPKSMVSQHLGIVHGSEFVMSRAEHRAKRDLLDKHYESENVTRSIDDDGDVVITINIPKGC